MTLTGKTGLRWLSKAVVHDLGLSTVLRCFLRGRTCRVVLVVRRVVYTTEVRVRPDAEADCG